MLTRHILIQECFLGGIQGANQALRVCVVPVALRVCVVPVAKCWFDTQSSGSLWLTACKAPTVHANQDNVTSHTQWDGHDRWVTFVFITVSSPQGHHTELPAGLLRGSSSVCFAISGMFCHQWEKVHPSARFKTRFLPFLPSVNSGKKRWYFGLAGV